MTTTPEQTLAEYDIVPVKVPMMRQVLADALRQAITERDKARTSIKDLRLAIIQYAPSQHYTRLWDAIRASEECE